MRQNSNSDSVTTRWIHKLTSFFSHKMPNSTEQHFYPTDIQISQPNKQNQDHSTLSQRQVLWFVEPKKRPLPKKHHDI